MTLFRKGLIRWYTHAFWYTFALTLGHAFIMYSLGNLAYAFYAKIACMFALRVNFGLGKYTIWTIFMIISLPTVELMASQKFAELTSAAGASEYLHGLNID